jgi:hypothetical protein
MAKGQYESQAFPALVGEVFLLGGGFTEKIVLWLRDGHDG